MRKRLACTALARRPPPARTTGMLSGRATLHPCSSRRLTWLTVDSELDGCSGDAEEPDPPTADDSTRVPSGAKSNTSEAARASSNAPTAHNLAPPCVRFLMWWLYHTHV